MKEKKGLTLIEIVISMALIGMVAIVFLTIFSSGNKNIFISGKKTIETLDIQENIDMQINNLEKGITDNEIENTKVSELKEIQVKIEGLEIKAIFGRFISGGKDNKKIITFIPN